MKFFVDYGEERHGFLPFKEVSGSYFNKDVNVPYVHDPRGARAKAKFCVGGEGRTRRRGRRPHDLISLAGRYLVLMPMTSRPYRRGTRQLRHLIEELKLPQGMSVIARTAGIRRADRGAAVGSRLPPEARSKAICDAATPEYELVRDENGHGGRSYVTDP